MNGPRVAYVMEQTLGSVTHYLNLRRQEGLCPGAPPRWLPIEFSPTTLPWAFWGSWRARRAVLRVLDDVDGLFIHTITIALLTPDLFRKRPAVLSSDGTPLNKHQMREAYRLSSDTALVTAAKRAVYRTVFSRAAGFVAWSHWTKQSFVNDYGCRAEDVAVIPPGIDLDDFAPGDRGHELARILFVGGDFKRKGGDLLLEVFRQRLRGRAELVLVTSANLPQEPGVRVHRNIRANSPELRKLYATSDIFALPTRADCYSLVCMEALAAGLPIVATKIGGIPDMVKEGVTGHLIEPDDSDTLGDALCHLAQSPATRARMGEACRADAVERFEVRDNARRLFDFVSSRC